MQSSIDSNKSGLRGLYAITDSQYLADTTFLDSIEQALLGGANIIQYRDKSQQTEKRLQQADGIVRLCEQHQAICIINDDIELASAVSAHGVHLGKQDGSIAAARKQLGAGAIIGASCYNQIALAETAQAEGADYVAFGAVYASPTKPLAATASLALLQQAKAQLDIPFCAIGGITTQNAQAVVDAGADMVAVISGLFVDDIHQTSQKLNNIESRAAHISTMFR